MIGSYIMNYSYIETDPIFLSSLDNARIENAIYDTVRIDNEITDTFDISEEWVETTKLLALFKGNLYAGNVDLGIKNTSNIIIKRRKYGEFEWFNMFDIPVVDVKSFNFNIIDKYPSATFDYQYAVVPIINGLEGEYNFGINDINGNDYISCDFDGFIILDRDSEYSSFMDVTFETQKNQIKNMITTLNSRYPFMIKNSQSNYYSGTVSATILKLVDSSYSPRESRMYREEFLNFLVNENVKILKYYDGRTFMVEITESPIDSANEHQEKHTVSFSFVEVGNLLSNEDMYNNGFLDITEAWWNT